jgi:hypothetical protein
VHQVRYLPELYKEARSEKKNWLGDGLLNLSVLQKENIAGWREGIYEPFGFHTILEI